MSCCDGIIKYLLFFFNLIFSLSGLGMIIAGSVLLHQSSEFNEILKEMKSGFLAPQIALIILGIIIFITATLGCCGAIQGNRCKLITYAVILLSIFIVELSIGIYAAVNINDIKDVVVKEIRKYFNQMFNYPEQEKVYHKMEELLQCCGVVGAQDYITNIKPVPSSCCASGSCGFLGRTDYWNVGCASALTDFSTSAGKIVAGLALVLAILEVVGAAFALRLASLVDRVY